MEDSANRVGRLGDERGGVRAWRDHVGGARDSVRQELAPTRHPGAARRMYASAALGMVMKSLVLRTIKGCVE